MVNRLDEEICISVKVKMGKQRRGRAAHGPGPARPFILACEDESGNIRLLGRDEDLERFHVSAYHDLPWRETTSANYVERSNQSMGPTAIRPYISFVMISFPYSAATHALTPGSSSCSR